MYLSNVFTTFLTILLTSYTNPAHAGCYVTGDFISAEETGIQVGRACHGYGNPRVAGLIPILDLARGRDLDTKDDNIKTRMITIPEDTIEVLGTV
ncbi:hypothetical protein M7I_7534 [Glarea lozoyensis 74030]|uniref:Uncharacterized protein n=1 Tax=Glarea lozoyensis (strain ATCC 74030 / MF5533) TaxID=1104152 RepID=H0EXJ8_GLAL7|nr:hypothetical protein M7I_7534 [Glarea lozoyensis 74030]